MWSHAKIHLGILSQLEVAPFDVGPVRFRSPFQESSHGSRAKQGYEACIALNSSWTPPVPGEENEMKHMLSVLNQHHDY